MSIMIDVGASNGCYSKDFDGTVFAFEPNKTNIELLKRIKRSNYFVYEMAINDIEGTQMFYEANYTNSSSLLPFTNEGVDRWLNPVNVKNKLKTIKQYPVNCIRLDTFIEKHALTKSQIDFLKIDTQGNDFNVIKSLGKYIHNVKKLTAEVQITPVQLYKGASTRHDLIDYMSKHGFKIYNEESWSRGQEVNITFIK